MMVSLNRNKIIRLVSNIKSNTESIVCRSFWLLLVFQFLHKLFAEALTIMIFGRNFLHLGLHPSFLKTCLLAPKTFWRLNNFLGTWFPGSPIFCTSGEDPHRRERKFTSFNQAQLSARMAGGSVRYQGGKPSWMPGWLKAGWVFYF